jgi:hypothetical protein
VLIRNERKIGLEGAALKAGMSLRTGRKYVKAGGLMPEQKQWKWRQTHKDCFAEIWETIEQMLTINPGLQSQTLMQWLMDKDPEKYNWSQLRTLQRRIRRWRALKGPDQEVMFGQVHIPGRQSQSDWTHGTELEVTIGGRPFRHMWFHFMLPYSRWETAFLSQSESYDNLTMGYMKAVAELGKVPKDHRTDNLTAAVTNHSGRHVFNERWEAFLAYHGARPSKNNPGESNENGSVEKSHHLFKNALDQALMLRGSRDFASVAQYEEFARRILEQRNEPRKKRLTEELAVMGDLPERHWNDPKEIYPQVTSFSTVSVGGALYSVPSRLIGRVLTALVYPEVVRVFLGETLVQEMPRLAPGDRKINYRHVISQLLRKPGAFANYQYREELFPSLVFRRAYDALKKWRPERADKEYLLILHQAATGSELNVETALTALLESGELPLSTAVRELVRDDCPGELPSVFIPAPDLCSYDDLFTHFWRAPKEVQHERTGTA